MKLLSLYLWFIVLLISLPKSFHGPLGMRMHCNWPPDHAFDHSSIGLNRLTIQLVFNEVSLFTFSKGTHDFYVTVPKNYLKANFLVDRKLPGQTMRWVSQLWYLSFFKYNISVQLFSFTEHGQYCGAFVNANGIQYLGGQVFSVPCHRADIHYVCDDTHHIRFINYYHPTPDRF